MVVIMEPSRLDYFSIPIRQQRSPESIMWLRALVLERHQQSVNSLLLRLIKFIPCQMFHTKGHLKEKYNVKKARKFCIKWNVSSIMLSFMPHIWRIICTKGVFLHHPFSPCTTILTMEVNKVLHKSNSFACFIMDRRPAICRFPETIQGAAISSRSRCLAKLDRCEIKHFPHSTVCYRKISCQKGRVM